MKLDLSCTDFSLKTDQSLSKKIIDLGGLRPSHPVLVVDRAECDLDADSSLTIAPEILHVKVVDTSNTKKSMRGCVAHFHIQVGVKNGRPFVHVCAGGHSMATDNKKKATGVWLPLPTK